ncbi:hypothetical protein E4U41_004311 [Claviceps citrina]|nr:hypothetical protein E4U41_004311 [Claviceps citrina]
MARFSFSIAGRKKQAVQSPAQLPPTSKAHRILGSTPLSIDAPPARNDRSSFTTSDDVSASPPCRPLGPGPLKEGTAMTKKELSRPDFLQTTPQEHDAFEKDSSITSPMDRMLKSASMLSTLTLLSTRSRQSRDNKRKNKKNLQLPVPEAPPSRSGGSVQLDHDKSTHASSLYNHYEQMPMRQVVRQSSTPNLQAADDGRMTLQNVAQGPCEGEANALPSHPSLLSPTYPRTPKTAIGLTRDWQSSPGRTVGSVPSRYIKIFKNTERSLEDRDLLQNSVLMLSSDSEEDEDGRSPEELGSHAASRSPESMFPRGQMDAASQLGPPFDVRTSRDTTFGAENGIEYSRMHGKRTSFASIDTHITLLSSGSRQTASESIASGPTNPYGDQIPTIASSRSSVISDRSTSSALTWQDESEFEIQEAQIISMLPTPRRSDLDTGVRMQSSSVFHRASSRNQLTPPLSPSSVDFYIHSPHSSIDGFACHTRWMAVTEQEKILLSAIRHKKQTMRQSSMSLVSEDNEQEKIGLPENNGKRHSTCTLADRSPSTGDSADPASEEYTAAKDHCSNRLQPNVDGATFSFGFPTPPSFRPSSNAQQRRATDPRKSSIGPIRITRFAHGAAVSLSSPSGPPPTMSLPALPKGRKSTRLLPSRETLSAPSARDVPLLYDDDDDEDDEPSPDLNDIREWESATSPAWPPSPRTRLTTPWHEEGNQSQGGDKPAQSPKPNSQTFPHPNSCSGPNSKKPVSVPLQKDEEIDIPRPDSPISPDLFPRTRTHSARLSAVGSGI